MCLEVEQLAALVAQVGHDHEQQAGEREAECREGGAGECQQRSAREWLGTQVGEHRVVANHLQRVERRAA